MGQFQPIVTLDLRLDYLRPAVEGETIIARCDATKLTTSIASSRVAHGGDPSARSPTAPAPSCSTPRAGLATSPLGALQHVIGRLDLAEALLGLLVALLQVRVMLLGERR
jgi:hypothetical protein